MSKRRMEIQDVGSIARRQDSKEVAGVGGGRRDEQPSKTFKGADDNGVDS